MSSDIVELYLKGILHALLFSPLPRHPLPTRIQTTGQLLLQTRRVRHVLLRTRVLGGPLSTARGHGHLARLLLGGLGGGMACTARDGAHELAEAVDLVQNHLAHILDLFDDFKVEIEGGGAVGLVGGVVPDLEVVVLQGLLNRNTAAGVECEHAVEEVERIGVGVGEQDGEGPLGHEGQVADVLLGAGGADAGKRHLVGRAQDLENLVELVDVVAALEEGARAQQLGQDTADRPDVNGLCVALEAEHDFGRAVPAGGDVFGHVASVLLRVDGKATGEAEIANLELAVGIDEQVTGLQVAVQDVGGVDVFQTTKNLVDEGLEVGVGQGLAGADNGRQVALHELLVEVGLVEAAWPRDVHIVQTSDLTVSEDSKLVRGKEGA